MMKYIFTEQIQGGREGEGGGEGKKVQFDFQEQTNLLYVLFFFRYTITYGTLIFRKVKLMTSNYNLKLYEIIFRTV